jgi:hypothetical protein
MFSRRRAMQWLLAGSVLAKMSVKAHAAKRDASDNAAGVVIDTSFGVKGDGKSNDRAALQAAIDACAGKLLLITGSSAIDSKGLTLRSNSHIRFAAGASITLLPHDTPEYQIFRIWDVHHVVLENPRLDGSKHLNAATNNPRADGYGMGISIAGSSNIQIDSPVTTNCWGDGIYIASSYTIPYAYSTAVRVTNHHASGCRRQGVSIISGKDILFERPLWENIGGTLPSAGLDIEPDGNADVLERIRIVQPTTRDCAIGILVYLSSLPGPARKTVDIEIDEHRDEGSIQAAYSIYGVKERGQAVGGHITSRSPTWVRPMHTPFVTFDVGAAGPSIEVTNRTIIP